MTVCILITAAAVTLAAAVRSTWSPCGLSMLSTITPVGERSRGNSYGATSAWFVGGAVVGGATLGAAMALVTGGVASLHLSETALGGVALVGAATTAASDAGVGGMRLPIHRRQVNERWLDHYRPWVYGAGFGWQIGNGLSTYITTAAVYLMVVLGAVTGDPLAAFALGTAFGTLRGLAVLLTRHLTGPSALLTFHRRFTAAGPVVAKIVVAVELAASVAFAAVLRSPIAVAVVIGVVTAVAAVAAATRRRRSLVP
jgi:hypothetical protein